MIIKQDGMTELFMASYCGAYRQVESLLRSGEDPNKRSLLDNNYNMLLLPDDIQTIVSRSISAKVGGQFDGWQPEKGFDNLYFPVIHCDVRTIKILLEAKADPNAVSMNGLFPLYLAAETGVMESVKLLVEHGAKLNMKTPKGRTALWNAADEGHENVVRYLLAEGADPEIANSNGHTPFDAACGSGHYAVARWLK